MGCRVQRGISNVCGDLLFPSGADGDFFVGYVSDLASPFSLTQTADIATFQFTAYNGLVKFQGTKFSHNFATEVVQAQGGNISFQQTATVKLISLSTQDDVEIQRLVQATDAFIVYKDNNGTYRIMGAGRGLKSIPGALQATGTTITDDVSDMVTLQGAEKTKPLIFNVGTEATTLAFLNARLI